MKEDFSELVEYLDQKFEKTATKEDVGNLAIKVADLDVRMGHVEERLEKLEESVHALTNAIDRLAKAVDDLRVEYSAMAMQLNRHEKWIKQLAEKLGMKLEYE